MTLNSRSLRPTSAATGAGLAKYRGLRASEPKDADKSGAQLPNGWYFNESNESNFWDDLEQMDAGKGICPSYEDESVDNFNDIASAARRVGGLLAKFDELDRDTVLELIQIVDQNGDNDAGGDFDQFSMISEAKNGVLLNIDELMDYSENQTKLMDSIRVWLTLTRQKMSAADEGDDEEMPDVDYVFDNLAKILQSYTDRTERAECLHNDVDDFWQKKVNVLKRSIAERDDEITKLQEAVQAAQAALKRKPVKRVNTKAMDAERAAFAEQAEQQIRKIQEQRAQIDQLRGMLQNSEVEKAMIGSLQASPTMVRDLKAARDHAQKIMEMEEKDTLNDVKMAELRKQLEEMRGNWVSERNKNAGFVQKLADRDNAMKEMDILLQKYIQQLMLERNKPPPAAVKTVVDESSILEVARLKEEIKQIKADRATELADLRETMDEKARHERAKLVRMMENPHDHEVLKSMMDDFDKRYSEQQKTYQEALESTNSNWTRKLGSLTKQYEQRIRSMKTLHENELSALRNSVRYDVKNAELDLQESFDRKLLDATKQMKDDVDSLREQNDAASDKIFKMEAHLSGLKDALKSVSPNSRLLGDTDSASVIDMIGTVAPSRKVHKDDETLIAGKYAHRYIQLKAELEEQHAWDIKQLNESHERLVHRSCHETQIAARDILLRVHESVQLVVSNLSDAQVRDQFSEAVASAFMSLNEHLDELKIDKNTLVDGEEAMKRGSKLTQTIVDLKHEIQRLKEDNGKGKKLESRTQALENEIKRLNDKVAYTETLASGDGKEAIDRLFKAEREFREEIVMKDALIEQLRDDLAKLLDKPELFATYPEPIFSYFEECVMSESCEEEEENDEFVSPESVVVPEDVSPQKPLNVEEVTVSEVVKVEIMSPPASDVSLREVPSPLNRSLRSVKSKSSKNRKQLSTVETQVDLFVPPEPEPVVYTFVIQKCESLAITSSGVTFKKTEAVQKVKASPSARTVARPVSRAKLFISTIFGVHRNDNFSAPEMVEFQEDEYSEDEEVYESVEDSVEVPSASPEKSPVVSGPASSPPESATPVDHDVPDVTVPTDPVPSNHSTPPIDPVPSNHSTPPIDPEPSKAKDPSRGSQALRRTVPVGKTCCRPRMRRVRACIVSFDPVPPQTVVIAADEDQMNQIRELQQQLRALSDSAIGNEAAVSRKVFLDCVKIGAANRLLRVVASRDREIDALRNRPREVVYETRIVNVPSGESPRVSVIPSPKRNVEITGVPPVIDSHPVVPSVSCVGEVPRRVKKKRSVARDRSTADVEVSVDKLSMPRGPIELVIPSSECLGVDQFSDDPFSSAISSLSSCMRFQAEMRENQRLISDGIVSDYRAYEAFRMATGHIDDNDSVFFDNLAELRRHMEHILVSYDSYGSMTRELTKILQLSKRRAHCLATEISDMRAQRVHTELTVQKELLQDIARTDDTASMLKQVSVTLDKIKNLGIKMTDDESSTFGSLVSRLSTLKSCIDPSFSSIDSMLVELQDYINGLIRHRDAEARRAESAAIVSQSELKQLRHDFKKVKGDLRHCRRDLGRSDEDNKLLMEKLHNLGRLLNEERESSSQVHDLYRSQLNVMRQLLMEIGHDNTASTEGNGVIEAIRKEVLSMHLLLESHMSQLRSLSDGKQSMELLVSEKESEIVKLKRYIEDLAVSSEEDEVHKQKARQENMFASVDGMTQHKLAEADRELINMQKLHVETVTGEVTLLSQKLREYESTLMRKNGELRSLQAENDDLTIRIACGFTRPSVKMFDRSTQTPIFVVPPSSNAKSVRGYDSDGTLIEVPAAAGSTVLTDNVDLADSSPVSGYIEHESDHGGEHFEEVPIQADRSDISQVNSVEGAVYVGVSSVEVGPVRSKRRLQFVGDSVPAKLRDNVSPPVKAPISTNFIGDNDSLSIGFRNRPPSRSIQSQLGRRSPQCTVSINQRARGAPIIPLVHPTNVQFVGQPRSECDPDSGCGVPRVPVELLDDGTGNCETMRITSFRFSESCNISGPGSCIRVDRNSSTKASRPGTAKSVSSYSSGPDIECIMRIIAKLKATIKDLHESSDEKDRLIGDLRMRLAEQSSNLYRSHIETIRARDNATRSVARSENVSLKLNSVLDDLGDQEEVNARLRRELITLRYAAMPAASQLRSVARAKREQRRIKNEQTVTETLLEATSRILKKTSDGKVKKYLGGLMKNAQSTMVRNASRRRYWKEVERKQVMGALSALSLLDGNISENTGKNCMSIFRSIVKPRAPLPIDPESFSICGDPGSRSPTRETYSSYAESMALIGQIDPPLTDEEKLCIIQQRVDHGLDERLASVAAANASEPIEEAVIHNS